MSCQSGLIIAWWWWGKGGGGGGAQVSFEEKSVDWEKYTGCVSTCKLV